LSGLKREVFKVVYIGGKGMPRLVKGAKWTFGWVIVGSNREIIIPTDAWDEYDFKAGDQAIFTPGSTKSGGFGISSQALLKEAGKKMKGAKLKELGRSTFNERSVILPKEMDHNPGDRLLAVRGSGFALGFIAKGPIYDEAMKHPELETHR
jgi:hypothetical protein